MRKFLVIAGLIAFSLPAVAQDTPTRLTPDALAWKENPAFPKGVQIATLMGDPTKAGDVVVLRIKFPPNFQMPPHTHYAWTGNEEGILQVQFVGPGGHRLRQSRRRSAQEVK